MECKMHNFARTFADSILMNIELKRTSQPPSPISEGMITRVLFWPANSPDPDCIENLKISSIRRLPNKSQDHCLSQKKLSQVSLIQCQIGTIKVLNVEKSIMENVEWSVEFFLISLIVITHV
ncbi:hypothetical protein BpHYR1_040527 [Brachionus plicatilis]|uniref:Uncharacterized protein n=1 Tax=Brachionus plicatilis TaxID=10195 RepID=A0A3M7RNP9_BRAPC|nr:hypothetical protein BpHYR1_040527 [Brachionus plicatilis]